VEAPARVSNDKQGSTSRSDAWRILIERCAAKDESALSRLYDESCRSVHGVAWTILRDSGEAEEVTLDIYSQIWKSAAAYSIEKGSVECWMLTMTRNRAIDRLWSATRYRPWIVKVPDVVSPESSAVASERRMRTVASVALLPADQRKVVELAFFEGLSHSELSRHLDLPLGTVKGRLRAAMVSLRQSLEGKV
jgi:RNA polymerase sigma factor (sigma-70 family)